MTDAEKAQLFVEFLGAANLVWANYMTLIFAMLTASWFLAARMSRAITVLFLFVYTFAAISIASGVIGSFNDFFALQAYLLETSAPDGPLRWLGPVREQFAFSESAMAWVITLAVLLPWLGSLIFFFTLRWQKSEDPKPD